MNYAIKERTLKDLTTLQGDLAAQGIFMDHNTAVHLLQVIATRELVDAVYSLQVRE